MMSIWQAVPHDITGRLQKAIQAGLARRSDHAPVQVFFRADDIGVPGHQFERLMALFVDCQVPLALALVPAWLTPARWRVLRALQKEMASLFCWHQHGWRHVNHERRGKKQEFGPARGQAAIEKDLAAGKDRLGRICGSAITPLFTPPWNRCTADTLAILKALSFKAVSRSKGNKPAPPRGLRDISVNVDLHTRKEPHPQKGWAALLSELQQSLTLGQCGVMIHHRQMNPAAFDFLELLLRAMVKEKDIYFLNLKGLCSRRETPQS